MPAAGTSASVVYLRHGKDCWMTLTFDRENRNLAPMRWHIPQARFQSGLSSVELLAV
jgi:hypothetical protein